MKNYQFELEERVKKTKGSYQAEGIIKARFLADDGTPRYVFRFDEPPGLLHIFNETQLTRIIPLKTVHFKKTGIKLDYTQTS